MSQHETIPGGKYLAADGKTFVDAWGKPIEVKEEAKEPKPAPQSKPTPKKGRSK